MQTPWITIPEVKVRAAQKRKGVVKMAILRRMRITKPGFWQLVFIKSR
jgi:hypothetical protein